MFNLLMDSSSVVLQAISSGLPGDFNGDGIVNATDYVVWRKNNYSQEQYNVLRRANFGRTFGGGSFAADSDLAGAGAVVARAVANRGGDSVPPERLCENLSIGFQ